MLVHDEQFTYTCRRKIGREEREEGLKREPVPPSRANIQIAVHFAIKQRDFNPTGN